MGIEAWLGLGPKSLGHITIYRKGLIRNRGIMKLDCAGAESSRIAVSWKRAHGTKPDVCWIFFAQKCWEIASDIFPTIVMLCGALFDNLGNGRRLLGFSKQ